MLFEILILILAIPVGFLISWLARDELVVGRKYFRWLIVICILGKIGSWIYGERVWSWTFGFIGIVSLIGFLKGFDGKWTRKRTDNYDQYRNS
jgi:hypothetical protein